MYRTEIYLRDDQREKLQDWSYLLTKQRKERVSVSHLIREALDYWMHNVSVPEGTEALVRSAEELAASGQTSSQKGVS